jgi:hypothetical protein
VAPFSWWSRLQPANPGRQADEPYELNLVVAVAAGLQPAEHILPKGHPETCATNRLPD